MLWLGVSFVVQHKTCRMFKKFSELKKKLKDCRRADFSSVAG